MQLAYTRYFISPITPFLGVLALLSSVLFSNILNKLSQPNLMADVKIVMAYKCYNMNTHKLEQLVHGFFGRSCLNIDVFDNNGNRHIPSEWFIAPLHVEQ